MKHFTEEDRHKLEPLEPKERIGFYMRFSDLMMKKRICDDTWERTTDEISIDVDKLVEDIHARLELLEKGE